MSVPIQWVEKIFTKLILVYGMDFLRRWEGIPIAEVKTDWAYCLSGFVDHPQAIAFALENLPDSRPPTALEFRSICRQAPKVSLPQLNASKADYAVVADQLSKIGKSVGIASPDQKRDHKLWAKRLKERHQKGEKLNLVQVSAYRNALDIRDSA